MKFKHYAELFLQIGRNDWKISTYSKYEIIVRKKLNFLDDRNIEDIKASDLRLWFASLKSSLSGKTLKDYRSCLNQIFLLAKYDETIKNNPIEYIKSPAVLKPKILPFTSDEVNRILEAAKKYDPKFRMFLQIGFFTGLRTGEILALKKEDVDIKNRLIFVTKTRSKFGELSPKTQGSIRKVPILDTIYYDLFFYVSILNGAYLFVNQYGDPYYDDSSFLKYYWRPLLKELGISYRKLYVMRHTYATNILKNTNLTPYELSKLLGHSSTEMVYNRYVKFIENETDNFKRDIKIY